jgi:hypothetical protein
MGGEIAHAGLRVGDDDKETCKATDEDLDRIAPPLTRILNRYDATRAAAVAGDEGLVIVGLGAYVGRNYTRRRRLIAARNAAGPQPITGRGPEVAPDQPRAPSDPMLVPPTPESPF